MYREYTNHVNYYMLLFLNMRIMSDDRIRCSHCVFAERSAFNAFILITLNNSQLDTI